MATDNAHKKNDMWRGGVNVPERLVLGLHGGGWKRMQRRKAGKAEKQQVAKDIEMRTG